MTFSLSLSVAQIQQLAEYAEQFDTDTVISITSVTEEVKEGDDVWPAGLYAGIDGEPELGCAYLDGADPGTGDPDEYDEESDNEDK